MKKVITLIIFVITALLTLTSCKKEVTISYNLNDGDVVVGKVNQKVKKGDNLYEVLKNVKVEREGYAFLGWSIDGTNLLEKDTTIKDKEIKVTPLFQKKYSITYKAEDQVLKTDYYLEGEKVTKPSDPVIDGYTFMGWDKNIPEVMPKNNLVINALLDANTYTITYVVEGQNDVVVKYKYNEEIKKPSDPVRDYYIFQGWDQEIPDVMPAYNLVLTANFEKWLPASVANGKELIFIGHAGCYLGIMNTEEAFINAAKIKGYKAIECDVKQTKDGVFVTCHDDKFADLSLATTNFADLKDVTITKTRGNGTYTSKICTFARYLEICKENHAYAVVELKSSKGITSSDQSRMPALMKEIEDAGMLDYVIFLGSQWQCMKWVRENGYTNIPCQYLVNSCESETILQRCIEYNFDISVNIDETYQNSQAWLDRYHDAGLFISSYTFNQYQSAAVLQKWIDKEVDYVTCDILTEKDVTITPHASKNLPTHKVTFKDEDGTIYSEVQVKQGRDAFLPSTPTKKGYKFLGWEGNYQNVEADSVVLAKWELDTYTISYNANAFEATTFTSKNAFIEEFYTDLFNWFSEKVGNISGLTKNGTTYSLSANGSTATWQDVASLKAIDIYVFEKTIGNFIYKPIATKNSIDYIPEVDDGYFLNTEPYRSKYIELNAYFLYVMDNNANYNGYSHEYQKASSGRVQIFFRFQQWQQGTNIPQFDILPKKYIVSSLEDLQIVLPSNQTYSINDEITLEDATREGYEFLGWYLDSKCEGEKITKIDKGTVGNIVLYAKWKKSE